MQELPVVPSHLRIDSRVSCRFHPLPNITAFELAVLLPHLMGSSMGEREWTALGSAQRHLVRTD